MILLFSHSYPYFQEAIEHAECKAGMNIYGYDSLDR